MYQRYNPPTPSTQYTQEHTNIPSNTMGSTSGVQSIALQKCNALNALKECVTLAQSRCAFSFEESAAIHTSIQRINKYIRNISGL